MISAEYIWIGGKNTYDDLRSKTRTLYFSDEIKDILLSKMTLRSENVYNNLNNEKWFVECIPEWNFDGSSTGQASSDFEEIK